MISSVYWWQQLLNTNEKITHILCGSHTIHTESTCLCTFQSSQCAFTIKLQLVSECWLRAMTVNQHNRCPHHNTVNSNIHTIAQSAYLKTVCCEVVRCSKSVSQKRISPNVLASRLHFILVNRENEDEKHMLGYCGQCHWNVEMLRWNAKKHRSVDLLYLFNLIDSDSACCFLSCCISFTFHHSSCNGYLDCLLPLGCLIPQINKQNFDTHGMSKFCPSSHISDFTLCLRSVLSCECLLYSCRCKLQGLNRKAPQTRLKTQIHINLHV